MPKERRIIGIVMALLLTAPMLACKSTRAVSADYTTPPEKSTCFDAQDARSFSPLHERFVYVRARGDQHYLLTMDRMCMGLPFASGIKLSRGHGRICWDTRASITFLGLNGDVSCGISRVEAVRDKEEAEALAKKRTTPPPPRR